MLFDRAKCDRGGAAYSPGDRFSYEKRKSRNEGPNQILSETLHGVMEEVRSQLLRLVGVANWRTWYVQADAGA